MIKLTMRYVFLLLMMMIGLGNQILLHGVTYADERPQLIPDVTDNSRFHTEITDSNSHILRIEPLKWAPHLDLELLHKLWTNYFCRADVPIPPRLAGNPPTTVDFGYSFPYSQTLHVIMNDIHQRAAKGVPPIVWDVACGHGFFAFYALIAGARVVYAIDKDEGILTYLQKNATKIKEFLREGTSIRKQLKIIVFDALTQNFGSLPTPDIIINNNYQHFLSPSTQVQVIQKFYQHLNLGGSCYLLGDSVYTSDDWKEPLLKRIQLQVKYPTYCWLAYTTGFDKFEVIPDHPNDFAEQEPGGIGFKRNYPGKFVITRNFLHPEPFKDILRSSGIKPSDYEIFFDGGLKSSYGLIAEVDFDGSITDAHQMLIVIRKSHSIAVK